MTRRPPRSTLFPYTTLSRSHVRSRMSQTPITNLTQPVHNGPSRVLDRKSTRLNSSHPSISYAVFCLNKKKLLFLLQSETGVLHYAAYRLVRFAAALQLSPP